jgi:hypothetical protein
MIDKTKSQPLPPTPKPVAPKPPEAAKEDQQAAPATATATVAKDTANLGAKAGPASTMKLKGEAKPDEFNPLDAKDSPGRTAADVGSNVVSGVEVAKDARGIAGIASTVAGRVSILSRLGSAVSTGVTKVADWGSRVATAAPKVGRAFAGVAKAAPVVGLLMAGLDIGRAALEKDPEKKREAKGTAALSTFSGVAGIAGAAMLATPLAPVGAALIVAGIGASVFSFVDTTFFKGAASKKIGDAVDAVADAGKAVGKGIADGAKKVWGAITSL